MTSRPPLERHYTLSQACEELLAGTGLKVRSLRTEIAKGRLKPARVAGRLLVTESMLRDMMEAARCQDAAGSRPVSILESAPAASPSGSSGTEATNPALAAALKTVRELKERSRATSRRGTSRRPASASSAS